jgi:SAM-dependent methyltransferase
VTSSSRVRRDRRSVRGRDPRRSSPETYFRSFVARVLELIPEGGTVLDLGCGAGLVTADLTTRARVVGVDISLAQLELARRNAPAARFVRADMVDLAFAPGSFDAVVAFWTLIHVPRVFHVSLLEGVHAWLRSGASSRGRSGAATTPPTTCRTSTEPPCTEVISTPRTTGACSGRQASNVLQADEIEDEGETPLWVVARA